MFGPSQRLACTYSRALAKGKCVQSNMEAKNHGVVLPDANVDAALNALVAAGFGVAGQRCMALSTVVIVGDSKPWLACTYSRASAKGKRVQSNMEAKNHGVVLPDANVDATLNALVAAGFGVVDKDAWH